MTTIRNINPTYGMDITFSADTLELALAEMRQTITECGYEAPRDLREGSDYQVVIMGRPIEMPGPIGELARTVGGVQALCDLLGGVAPSTVRRWAIGETEPGGPAHALLARLLDEHLGYRIILDNGGGVTLQLAGEWAHYYQDPAQAAVDLQAWIDTRDASDWEGHEDEALDCEPTADQVCNGGYRVITDIFDLDPDHGWGNEIDLAKAMRG